MDVSALGVAMAKAEVHKAVDLGVAHEQIQESAVKTASEKPTRKLPIVDVNRSSFPVEEIAKITKKKKKLIRFIGKQVLSMTKKAIRDIVHAMSRMCGNRGNQYEYKENKFTKCHKCNAKLKIVQATKNGFPERDAFGNFT